MQAALRKDLENRTGAIAAAMLHDIGKYSLAFQEKIKNNSDKRVDHSTAGAKECFKKGRMYEFMSYCIAGHHSGLPDHGSSFDAGNRAYIGGQKMETD